MEKLKDGVSFRVEGMNDEELQGWTISIPEIDLYGEEITKDKAISDLVSSIKEYTSLYTESKFLIKHESPEKQEAIIKLMRCENDEKIRKSLGLQ